MNKWLILCLLVSPLGALLANPDSTFLLQIDTANSFAKTILADRNQATRLEAHKNLEAYLQKMLANPANKDVDYAQHLKGVSVQTPADKAFNLFSWQVFVDDSTYLYGGMLQTQKGDVFKLTDKAAEHRQAQLLRLKHTDWYGGLYYNVVPFEHKNKQMYLLFSYNAHAFFTKRKILDVLHFENGKPKFGYNCIEMQDARKKKQTVQRFILEYSSAVMVTMNYNPTDQMVVYDHLLAGSTNGKKGGTSGVPDGSYCGLRLEKGVWKFVEKIHNDEYDPATTWNNPTAPTPHPVEDFDNKKKQKNIFGREGAPRPIK